ncbi:MAG: hypothetical protein LQ351_005373 [Letrouitia transgressa]|nr:MAG: hypothetical protein LQ351_005373 [Letrouitia transgressa]
MSNSQMPNGRPVKSMSSKLLTMRFMQRAAASSSGSPTSSEQTPDTPPSKRRKIVSASSETNQFSDFHALQAAADVEEKKRAEAIDRLAENAGETKWVLSYFGAEGMSADGNKGLQVLAASYSDIDLEGSNTKTTDSLGRRSFGRFNKDLEKQQKATMVDDSSLQSDEEDILESDGSNDAETDDSSAELLRQLKSETLQEAQIERKAQRKAEKVEAARMAEKGKFKEVKLNKLSSISGAGGAGRESSVVRSEIICYSCGQKGHRKAECPLKIRRKRRRGEGDDLLETQALQLDY